MRIITVKANDAGQRLDKFITKLMPALPKGMLYKLIRKKDIRLNGKRCQGSEILSEGDVLRIFAKEEFFAAQEERTFLKAEGEPEIAYEDANILIACKPSGMFAHGGEGGAVSLLDEIQKYLYNKGLYDPQTEQTFAPALCNRIDRNTEGLVIAAVNAPALRCMNAAIKARYVRKHYLAVTSAHLPQQSDTCTAWLKKDPQTNRVTVLAEAPDSSYKCIRTRYTVLAEHGSRQLVDIELLTGRTHQIRAHLAFLGAPLLGDPKYGRQTAQEENQCLCAYSLHFTGLEGTVLESLNGITVTAPLPDFVHRYFPDYSPARS